MTRFSRRSLLSAGAAAALFGATRQANALRGAHYGGNLRLSLPLSLRSIDPHDLHDPLAGLLGSSMFSTLYSLTARGTAYPSLAASLPQVVGSEVSCTLRPHLKSAKGVRLDAQAVSSSLSRAQKQLGIRIFEGIRAKSSSEVRLRLSAGVDASTAAKLLATPALALVPPHFNPRAPDCTGALSLAGGLSQLERNLHAPRGGSFLDGVTLTTRSLTDCLRDFESGRSDLNLVGAGLYGRRKTQGLEPGLLGSAVLCPGRQLGEFSRAGVIESTLSHLPGRGFEALGLSRSRATAWSWKGPQARILVDGDSPWLVAVATELARVWSDRGTTLSVQKTNAATLNARIQDGDHQLALTYLRADAGGDLAIRKLFQLSGAAAPRGRLPSSLLGAARRLQPGIVGGFAPSGVAREELSGVVGEGRLRLNSCEFRTI